MTYEKIKQSIDKNLLKDLYENQLLSISKIGLQLHISDETVKKLVKEYQFIRDDGLVKSKSNRESKSTHYNNIKVTVTKESLYNFYIKENHSYQDTLEHFHVKGWTLDKLLSEYNIKKDRHISGKAGNEIKYKQAGGKDSYIKQTIDKQEQTIISKYGSLENFYKERQDALEQKNIEKYGFKYKATADLVGNHSEKYQKVWGSKEESINYLSSLITPTVEFLAEDLNTTVNCIHLWIEKYQLGQYIHYTKSHYEEDIVSFINKLGFSVERNNRKILDNYKELDIYIPEKKLAIEFNGNYFHSSEQVTRNYHFNKSYECEQKGIRLIHIYQYQWDDLIKREILKSIIKNALGKNDNIIYARKCELKELTKKGVEEFSKLNSLHGHRNASIYLGLFYNNELVEVMTFGKAFFSRDNSIDYECIRSITKINTTVIGGMNKLFKYFINKYNPSKILYYVDYNTHNGNSMPKLGFKFINYSKYGFVNVSNSKEVMEKYGLVFNRKPDKNKELGKYAAEGKLLTIYDAGVKKYIWTK